MADKKKNIILIGMPGVGKSTVGVVLAKRCGYRFMDSDLIIQDLHQKLLHELIAEHGIDGFLEIENRINASIDTENAVIATGGSAVYGKDAMKHFAEIGTIVYLKMPYEGIRRRLGDLAKRGVTLREGQTLYDLYKERVPLYEKYADVIVVCKGKPIRKIVELVWERVNNLQNSE